MSTRKFLSTLIPALPMLLTALLVILVTVIFLAAMRSKAHAQFGGVEQPMFQNPVSTGDNLPPGIGFRWVASDLTNSPVSQWVDRIQGAVFFASTNQPIWVSNRVNFHATNWLQAATAFSVDASGVPNDAAIFLVASQAQPSAAGAFLGSTNASDYVSVLSAGNVLRWGLASLGPMADNTVFDFLYSGDANSNRIYTNNIFITTQTATLTGLRYLGTHTPPATANLTGSIYEIIIWTNVGSFSAGQLAAIHYYATNTYGFFP